MGFMNFTGCFLISYPEIKLTYLRKFVIQNNEFIRSLYGEDAGKVFVKIIYT